MASDAMTEMEALHFIAKSVSSCISRGSLSHFDNKDLDKAVLALNTLGHIDAAKTMKCYQAYLREHSAIA